MGSSEQIGAPSSQLGRVVESLAVATAVLGGALLTAIVGLSVFSIARRTIGYDPILGDFEIVQNGLASCVALFLPYCQLKGGNISVDFFTTRASHRTRSRLDAIGAVLMALVMVFVAWRTSAGALGAIASGETTMLLGVPLWLSYAAMVPGFVITALVALHCAREAWTGTRP